MHLNPEDRDANAPEVLNVATTPSTFVASPATNFSHAATADGSYAAGADDGAKEAVVYDKSEKIAIDLPNEYHNSPYPEVVGGHVDGRRLDVDAERSVANPGASSTKQPSAKILGLKRRTFFIALIAIVLIIVAVIGGAVGGTLGSGKSHSSSAAAETDANS